MATLDPHEDQCGVVPRATEKKRFTIENKKEAFDKVKAIITYIRRLFLRTRRNKERMKEFERLRVDI